MMKLFRMQSLKAKSANGASHNNDAQENQKKKRKKRKSIVFKPEKRAKVQKNSVNCSKDDISEISFSIDEEKTILSDGRSDFDNDRHNGNDDFECMDMDRSMGTTSSSSLLNEFFDPSLDDSYSNDVESSEVKHSFVPEDEDSHDSINSALNELIEKSQDEESGSEDSISGFELHECDTDYVVILNYSQTIRIFGFCDLKVLHGKINILGYTLDSSSTKQSIYSPKGTALLTITNTSNYCDGTRKMRNLIPKLSKHPILKDLEVRKDSSVLLFLKKHDTTLNFIDKHISQWIVPKKTSFPCIEINPKGPWNSVIIPDEWKEVVQNVIGQSRILVCGGKGVGKSTFLRYAINCLLQKYESVRVIDLDPGQSEFTVPSTLSVVSVQEPLLGVNYTHLKNSERSILSDINVAPDPDKFIECIREISKNNLYLPNVPTIINTMGFTNDIAYHLISSTVALLEPNRIVYIESGSKKKNFKIALNKETLTKHAKLFTPYSKLDFGFEIEKIPSATDENVGWTLQPRQTREMSTLAYFGQNMAENCCTLQDYRLPMFEVDSLDVKLVDKNNTNVPIEAVNANIVALCQLVNEDDAIFECFGWGVVRCHDPSSRKIILITPTNKDSLNRVTHLVVGCLTLPPSVYMNQEGVVGHIPYVMVSDLKGLAQMSKRTRIPFDADKK